MPPEEPQNVLSQGKDTTSSPPCSRCRSGTQVLRLACLRPLKCACCTELPKLQGR